jgi:putative acetyltransferase
MTIRRYQPGEESAIWNVYFRTTHESNARDYHPDLLHRWAPPDQDMDQWRLRVMDRNPFVAEVEGQIVGMAEMDEQGGIDYFYVLPEFQGQRIGLSLLKALESEARKNEVRALTADVSHTAKKFFESQGFQVVEARANVILGHSAPNFAMRKEVV